MFSCTEKSADGRKRQYTLVDASDTPIVRHIKIKAAANPHDPAWDEYFESRWGKKAYADGDRWWRGLSADEKAAWKQRVADLGTDWIALAEAGADPASPEAQDVARRHVEWLTGVPGTPAYGAGGDRKAYVIGLGEMYVADPRFGANYATDADRAGTEQGTAGAEFVRDALRVYAEGNL